MFEDAHYRWQDDPDDGEYEFQFDRFESTTDYHDQVVLIIVDSAKDDDIGDVVLPTADVPDLDPDDPATTRIFHGTVEDGEIIEMRYDQELSEQRHEKYQERLDRMHGNTDEESEIGTDMTRDDDDG